MTPHTQHNSRTDLIRFFLRIYITFSVVLEIFLLSMFADDDSWGSDFFIPLIFGKDDSPPELEATEPCG